MVFYSLRRTFADGKQRLGLSLVPTTSVARREGRAREESPGSTGHPTSENGSSWRQLVSEEENDRHIYYGKGEKVV